MKFSGDVLGMLCAVTFCKVLEAYSLICIDLVCFKLLCDSIDLTSLPTASALPWSSFRIQ
jgi:hypothetical protein